MPGSEASGKVSDTTDEVAADAKSSEAEPTSAKKTAAFETAVGGGTELDSSEDRCSCTSVGRLFDTSPAASFSSGGRTSSINASSWQWGSGT